jgi:hypothetical protein
MNPQSHGDENIEKRLKIAESLIKALFESHEKTEIELRMLAKSQVLMVEAQQKTELRLLEVADKLDALVNRMDLHRRA